MTARRTTATITVKDNGANAAVANAAVLFRVSIGVLGAKADALHGTDDPKAKTLTVAEIAEKHELGLGVPERSFLRAYVDAEELQIRRDLQAAYKQILRGKFTPARAAAILGAKHAAGVQQYIADGKVVPPNAPATIARKGSSTPLIDTGQLRSAITFVVTKVLGGRAGVVRGREG